MAWESGNNLPPLARDSRGRGSTLREDDHQSAEHSPESPNCPAETSDPAHVRGAVQIGVASPELQVKSGRAVPAQRRLGADLRDLARGRFASRPNRPRRPSLQKRPIANMSNCVRPALALRLAAAVCRSTQDCAHPPFRAQPDANKTVPAREVMKRVGTPAAAPSASPRRC